MHYYKSMQGPLLEAGMARCVGCGWERAAWILNVGCLQAALIARGRFPALMDVFCRRGHNIPLSESCDWPGDGWCSVFALLVFEYNLHVVLCQSLMVRLALTNLRF